MNVLVLDPDASSRDALRQGFAAAGAAVRVFTEAAEAERGLPEFQPEVLVADHAHYKLWYEPVDTPAGRTEP